MRPSRGGETKPLVRGWRKGKLMRELASGDYTQAALARKYGVSDAAISQFKKRYAEEIEEIREDYDNELAGIWIARKENRLREYLQDLEDINDYLDGELDEDSPQFLRLKQNILKAVAEELGQIPSKMQISLGDKKITYVIEDVDLNQLT